MIRRSALRITWAVLFAAPFLGCQEYDLHGKDESPGGEDSAIDTSPSTETDAACDALDLPLAEPLDDASPTCSVVDANWDVVIEADFHVPDEYNAAGFAPYLPGESPEILVCGLDSAARLVRMTAIDPQSGAMRSSEGIYGDCSSFAWGVGENGTTVGAFGAVIDDPGVALTTDPNEPWAVGLSSPWESLPVVADLDGDGHDEAVTYDRSGLRIFDVVTRTLLAHRPDICSATWQTPPALVDVDGDGSGEILVVGGPGPCLDNSIGGEHVYVLGPAEGRWSRTRPVWNQLPYDPALIADDGTLVTWPAWSNRFRSQPGRDGERPDLAPELVDVCVDDCTTGSAWWSVRVQNTGSADAPAGTQVVIASAAAGELAVGTIDTPIPAGWASDAIRLEAHAADPSGPLRIEVRNDAISECDPDNDRLDVDVPCPGD